MNYTTKGKFNLLRKYGQIRENLFNYTTHFYDAMSSDIEGYWEELENLDESDIKELEEKIKNFEALTKCYAKIDFKYC
jgi:hypothetical protein